MSDKDSNPWSREMSTSFALQSLCQGRELGAGRPSDDPTNIDHLGSPR